MIKYIKYNIKYIEYDNNDLILMIQDIKKDTYKIDIYYHAQFDCEKYGFRLRDNNEVWFVTLPFEECKKIIESRLNIKYNQLYDYMNLTKEEFIIKNIID